MQGLSDIRRMNATARVVDTKQVMLTVDALSEYRECVQAACDAYNRGAYTMAQFNEELAELKAIYN